MDSDWNSYWSTKPENPKRRFPWSVQRMMSILDRYVTDRLIVLDAGCGSGVFTNYFLSKGCQVCALDYSGMALDLTRKATAGRCFAYQQSDLLRNDLPADFSRKFDFVFTDGLFEHFPKEDQRTIMRNLVAMTRDNGRVFTFVPNILSYWTIVRPFVMRGIHEKPFRLRALLDLARDTDQKVVAIGGAAVLPFRHSPERLGKWFGQVFYMVSSPLIETLPPIGIKPE